MKVFAAQLLAFVAAAVELPADTSATIDENSVDIIGNAQTWLNPSIPYSQTDYHNGYRTDCSGYVSMAWQLGTSAVTWTLPNYSFEISPQDLQSGDVLLNISEHVLIFDSWVDSGMTQYWAYEQSPPYTHFHIVDYPYWAGYDPELYVPYRLALYGKNIQMNMAVAVIQAADKILDDATEFKVNNSVNVIANAKTWLNPAVPYSQSAYHNGYRTDCSGYVSMAWQLGTSATTSTLKNYSSPITKDQLKAGDVLLNAGEHVLIFSSWANSAKTQYYSYEQTPPGTVYHVVDYPYWSNHNPSAYKPYRLHGNSIQNQEAQDNII